MTRTERTWHLYLLLLLRTMALRRRQGFKETQRNKDCLTTMLCVIVVLQRQQRISETIVSQHSTRLKRSDSGRKSYWREETQETPLSRDMASLI